MDFLRRFCFIVVVGTFVFSCGKVASHSAENESKSIARELPIPVPPSTITDPQARGAYMVNHFWDALPGLPPEQKGDTALIEQTFANFTNLLYYVTTADVDAAAGALVRNACEDAETVRLIEYIADKYLADPNSPMRSEDLYIPILRAFTSSALIPGDVSARASYALEIALKNRPGSRAADLSLILPSGASSSLHSLVKSDTTIVIFFDPECPHCAEITAHVAEITPRLPYKILAIDVTADRTSLETQKFPTSWTVAITGRPIEEGDDDRYVFPALPSLYLLAPGATVLLKDFSPSLLPN